MNKAYEVIDNEVTVYDEYFCESTREYSNNIEEILVTENNIEEIEELINEEMYNKAKRNSGELFAPTLLGIGTGQLILSVYKFISNDIPAAITHFLSSFLLSTLAYFGSIKQFIKKRKTSNMRLDILNEKLVEEAEKLNKLNNDKNNDLMFASTNEIKINRSEQIDILKNRLIDVRFYVENKHKFIKLYKKGILEKELYESFVPKDTIDFITELVENDLGIHNNNNKQKKLSRNK